VIRDPRRPSSHCRDAARGRRDHAGSARRMQSGVRTRRYAGELRPGTRIVSHRFGLGDWPPERIIEAGGHPLLLWTVP
jgi:hypothetical protein